MNKLLVILLISILANGTLFAQTIAEKKAGLGQHVGSDLSAEMQTFLRQVNEELEAQQKELERLYARAMHLYQQNAEPEAFKQLLEQINLIRGQKLILEERWREMATRNTQEEEYALWHQPNSTLEQLVIDYGSQDYVYLIPQEIGGIMVSIDSNIPIPRAAWSEMLEVILGQNGVGIKQLNPYLRQLYLIKEDRSGLSLITNKRQDLGVLPGNERIAFVLSPEPSDVRRVRFFLEKFVNPNNVVLQQIGRDILIVGQVSEVHELLKLYDFVSTHRGDREYRTVSLERVDAEEMAKILNAIFGFLNEEPPLDGNAVGVPAPANGSGDNGLRVIPLGKVASAIFLIGTREEIRKAESIIAEVENEVGEARSKVIYWYTAKHSDPEELAEILYRIYYLMVENQVGMEEDPCCPNGGVNVQVGTDDPDFPPPLPIAYQEGYYFDPNFVINKRPPPVPQMVNFDRENFIVDLKTASIAMVVEADILPKLKELLKKLDVPKKMVQIEVLLFEKKLTRENDFGLNRLKAGSEASKCNSTGATFNVVSGPVGIFEFLISRTQHGFIPAFDAAYRFLLTQDDVYINACPSVLTMNQTPALIEIAEEISVNTGIFEVETIGGVTLKDAFARAQYGITIEITPTVHGSLGNDYCSPDDDDYVTLVTDITFQTFNSDVNSRPDITTRHIVNEVRIPDGQSVILGGLRKRQTHDRVEKIPFFGELPGVGKLFSLNEMNDETTEMFIFLTPKIIYDPAEDLERVRRYELCLRAGDIPAFLCCLAAAEEVESRRLMESTLTMLFGRRLDRCVMPLGEYDGR